MPFNMYTVEQLRKKYLKTIAPWEADTLLQYSFDKTKEFLLTHPDYRPGLRQIIRFYFSLYRFRHGHPLAHITHHKEFFGLNFFINKHVLVPRPETELVVEEVLNILQRQTPDLLIDLGTGSGCIPISILKNFNGERKTLATDISEKALSVARKNARTHGVNIEFLKGDLLNPVLDKIIKAKSFVLTANLPYGWKAWKNNGSIESYRLRYEPQVALFSTNDGLGHYQKLLMQLKTITTPFTALFEFDPRQTELLTKLICEHLPSAKLEIKKDLAGRDRLAIISNS